MIPLSSNCFLTCSGCGRIPVLPVWNLTPQQPQTAPAARTAEQLVSRGGYSRGINYTEWPGTGQTHPQSASCSTVWHMTEAPWHVVGYCLLSFWSSPLSLPCFSTLCIVSSSDSKVIRGNNYVNRMSYPLWYNINATTIKFSTCYHVLKSHTSVIWWQLSQLHSLR